MSLPYFPLYPTDFDGKTAHLTLLEDGAYNRLLRLCWKTPGCRIPADEAWIMRHMRAISSDEQNAVRTILGEFFVAKGGYYTNKKLSEIYAVSNQAHERRKNAGSKGGKAKSLKNNKTVSSNAVAKPKQPEPEPEPDNTTLPDARAMCAALGVSDETKSPGLLSLSEPMHWLASGCDMQLDILPTLRQIAARGKVVSSWAYCSRAVFEARDRRLAPRPEITTPIQSANYQHRSKPKSVAAIAMERARQAGGA